MAIRIPNQEGCSAIFRPDSAQGLCRDSSWANLSPAGASFNNVFVLSRPVGFERLGRGWTAGVKTRLPPADGSWRLWHKGREALVRIVIAADHAGYQLKQKIGEFLRQSGHQVADLGTQQPDVPSDYPDLAAAVARAVAGGTADRGVLLCGSGVGASIAANKIRGVRAGLCHDSYSAHQGVEHDDMNVLVLGARVIGTELARELVKIFLAARFGGQERHQRRLDKLKALDEQR
ncbi:MAG: ribose 5-phosphate isomerase B [Acidobacteria bacterium]|nr:ribose 5-phosphate isomerase B [Acidobacteriota bacterium]